MFYVYIKRIKKGDTQFIREFSTEEDAIRHIANCYRLDGNMGQLGEYYYFMKQR